MRYLSTLPYSRDETILLDNHFQSPLRLEQSHNTIDNINTPVREDRASATDHLNYLNRGAVKVYSFLLVSSEIIQMHYC